MKVVESVNERSKAMAFGAALALWGIMQGKAAMRYFVDVPGTNCSLTHRHSQSNITNDPTLHFFVSVAANDVV